MKRNFKKIKNDIRSEKDSGFAISTNEGKEIPAFKCPQCLQHQSLFNYGIDKKGVVTPTFECQCGYKDDIEFDIWDGKKTKKQHNVYID